jgi:hypothetical protein
MLMWFHAIDPNDQAHLVRMLDFFEYRGHLCIVFEVKSLL